MKKIDIQNMMEKIETLKQEHALREIAALVDHHCALAQLCEIPKKLVSLPKVIYIVTGHFRKYSSRIIGLFYSESSATKFTDKVESTKEYDWIGYREYKVPECSLPEKPKVVYLVICQHYLSDPDIMKVFYLKDEAIEYDSRYRSAYVRWQEFEIKE